MRYFLRVLKSTAKATLISQWRFLSWTGFALRFFPPLLNLGVAWVLYNTLFKGQTSQTFIDATNSSDYFSFVLIGSIFFVYVTSTLFVVGRALFWERMQGTIEALFLSPINYVAYMLGITVAAFGSSTLDLSILFSVGYAFGFRVSHINIPLLISGFVLMMFSLFGLGLIINAITLTFRDRTNTANTLSIVLLVFSGIVCPITLMPNWAQIISKAIPFTYAIDIIRTALISRSEAISVSWHVVNLVTLACIYVVIGIVLLRRIEKNCKKNALLTAF